MIFEPGQSYSSTLTCAASEASDQPVHLRSLHWPHEALGAELSIERRTKALIRLRGSELSQGAHVNGGMAVWRLICDSFKHSTWVLIKKMKEIVFCLLVLKFKLEHNETYRISPESVED